MDFQNHPLNRKNIDSPNRLVNKVNVSIEAQSIGEHTTQYFREKLQDPTIDTAFIKKCLRTVSEKDMLDFADYALRKANNPGRAFVKLCSNAMRYKTLAEKP